MIIQIPSLLPYKQNGTVVLLNVIIMKFNPYEILYKTRGRICNDNCELQSSFSSHRASLEAEGKEYKLWSQGILGSNPDIITSVLLWARFCILSKLKVPHLFNGDSILTDGCEN